MALKNLFNKKQNGWQEVEAEVRKQIVDTLNKNKITCIDVDDLDELFDIYQQLRLEIAREKGLIGNSQNSTTP